MTTYGRVLTVLAGGALAGAAFLAPSASAQARTRPQTANGVIANTAPTAAATDYFLKMEGVEGESKDKDHKDWVDILSWSWGEPGSRANRRAPTGSGAGTLTIVKPVDKASPRLSDACTSGRSLGRVVVEARTGGTVTAYILDDTTVRSCSSDSSGGASDDRPTENISLNFGKVESSTRPGTRINAGEGRNGNPDRPVITGRQR
jgi:type VI secretion system secreted protein Hcp